MSIDLFFSTSKRSSNNKIIRSYRWIVYTLCNPQSLSDNFFLPTICVCTIRVCVYIEFRRHGKRKRRNSEAQDVCTQLRPRVCFYLMNDMWVRFVCVCVFLCICAEHIITPNRAKRMVSRR